VRLAGCLVLKGSFPKMITPVLESMRTAESADTRSGEGVTVLGAERAGAGMSVRSTAIAATIVKTRLAVFIA